MDLALFLGLFGIPWAAVWGIAIMHTLKVGYARWRDGSYTYREEQPGWFWFHIVWLCAVALVPEIAYVIYWVQHR